MTHDATKVLNQRLEDNQLRSIEKFTADAITCVTWHGGNATALTKHLADWRDNDYDPARLSQNIRGILKFARDTLAKRQFRCDGTREHLAQTITDIRQHVTTDYVDHLERVIEAHDLITWCDTYVTLVAVPATT